VTARSTDTPAQYGIWRANQSNVDLVATVIGHAFQHLDVAAWMIPERDQRQPVLQANMTIWVAHALASGGIVDVTEDGRAVAVWVINGSEPGEAPPDYERRLLDACGPYTARFKQLDTAFEQNHPHGTPHHHLAFMAVLPDSQGRGRGTALLNHHHGEFPDAPAYLEASCPASRALYARHGYADIDGPFTLPDNGPKMWPMWRPPASP
jgi:GNAT superfamily N-acetyltransferase